MRETEKAVAGLGPLAKVPLKYWWDFWLARQKRRMWLANNQHTEGVRADGHRAQKKAACKEGGM